MPGQFNHGAWISQVAQRLNHIESQIRNGKPPTNGKTGESDLDPREADVLKRAFIGLEQEFDTVRRDLSSVVQEHRELHGARSLGSTARVGLSRRATPESTLVSVSSPTRSTPTPRSSKASRSRRSGPSRRSS